MKTHWIYVGFVISALMWGGARAQDTTAKTCQSAFEASPAGKSCEASLEKNWGKCSGMVQCGDEGPYHRLSGLSIDETERLIFCNEKAVRMKDAPDSCLTQQEQDTRRAEDAAAKAQKEACTEAWKQSSSAKTCTAEVDPVVGGMCAVFGKCQPETEDPKTIVMSVNDAKNLQNCNGTLVVGACPDAPPSAWAPFQALQDKATAAQALYKAHDAQCLAAWKASSAQATCITTEFITRESGNKCLIHVQCGSGEGAVSGDFGNMEFTDSGALTPKQRPKMESAMTISEEDMKNLTNCKGTLTVGPCS